MNNTPANYPCGKGGQQTNCLPQPESVWHSVADEIDPALIDMKPVMLGDFPDEWRAMLYDLIDLWRIKYARNALRYRYYDGKNVLKDFGIAIPPTLRNVETVVGWPQKAVDTMAVRLRFDGFTAENADTQKMLDDLLKRSHFAEKYRQAVQSTLIHSCCFATVNVYDDGLPRIDFYSAERAAARWDDAKGRIAYGMTIDDMYNGVPVEISLYTDDYCIRLWLTEIGQWDWIAQPCALGRPAMDALKYRTTFKKPFGQSRITRGVMSTTDDAVREALRTEISAEFFTSPQKYLLGADSEAFAHKTKWEAYIGNIFAVSRDEDGNLPQFGQLAQGTMQPHTEYMRSLAARFSGETNVPISQLGIIHDNPASAEAIYAASEPLIIECNDFNDDAGIVLTNLALMAIAGQVDKPISELDESLTDFMPHFKDPAMPSIVSQADAMLKIASVVPGLAGTDTFFEGIGWNEAQRKKAMSDIRRNAGTFFLNQILTNQQLATVDNGGTDV